MDVSQDGTAATITLPHARFYDADLDLERSYVYDRDEGLFNRIGGIFTGDDEYEREALLAAEQKLDESAKANGELARRAEENTAAMLESLVRSLGFASVRRPLRIRRLAGSHEQPGRGLLAQGHLAAAALDGERVALDGAQLDRRARDEARVVVPVEQVAVVLGQADDLGV